MPELKLRFWEDWAREYDAKKWERLLEKIMLHNRRRDGDEDSILSLDTNRLMTPI
jgi:hypothetical protein